MMTATPKADDNTVYIADNGATYCGKHLGASARYTLRDISGQPIMAITPDVIRVDPSAADCECEKCGKRPSRLYVTT